MANARPFDDSEELAHEIDRLLKQLPPAEPIVRAPPAYRASGSTHAMGHATGSNGAAHGIAARRAQRNERLARGEPSVNRQLALIWTRVLLAAALGVALTQWPYARACGWMLYAYLMVISAVLVAAGWAAIESWRGRVASAHLVSLIIGFWGIVLAAEQVLPRVGYAATASEWSCFAARPGG